MYNITNIVILLLLLVIAQNSFGITCGDYDNDDQTNVADLVNMVDYIFKGGPPAYYPPAIDCDGNGEINVADLTGWVDWLFKGITDPNACPFIIITEHEDNSSGCLMDSLSDKQSPLKSLSKGTLEVEVIGDDLLVHHQNAYYQCCLMYKVDWYQSDNVLTGFEVDTGALCDCYCPFHLTSMIYDLPAGEYSVVLIGIEGDTVGTTIVTIEDSQIIVQYDDSGCKKEKSERVESVDYDYSGDSLTMTHWNAYLNCAAYIIVDFEVSEDTLRFIERNINYGVPVPCECYFDIWAIAVGISSGYYTIELYQQAYYFSDMELIDRRTLDLH